MIVLGLTFAGCPKDPLDGDPVFCIARTQEIDPETKLGTMLKLLAGGRTDDDLTSLRSLCDDELRPLIRDGEAFTVVHVLHRQIRTDSKLRLTLETPCGAMHSEENHVDGIVETSFVAPAGSSCLLTVTATIDNSELRRHSARGPSCGIVATLCSASDAGVAPRDAGE